MIKQSKCIILFMGIMCMAPIHTSERSRSIPILGQLYKNRSQFMDTAAVMTSLTLYKPEFSRQPSYRGICAEDFQPPSINHGQKVLDIGAGDGTITQKLIDMAGKDHVYAIEPDTSKFQLLTERIGHSQQTQPITLQDALASQPKTFRSAFDVITIFKYNIPLTERNSFIRSLFKAIRQNGLIYISSVERERFFDTNHNAYLISHLKRYFQVSTLREIINFQGSYGLLTLKPLAPDQITENSVGC